MFTERAMIVSSGFPYGVIGFLFFSIIISCFKINSGRALNDFIRHFEPVFFDQHHMRDHHRRSIRSAVERHIHLQFFAYGRMFRLRLERDPLVFADRAQFENSGSDAVHYDTTRALTGHAVGEDNSSVQGVLLSSGLFDGTIRIGDEELYVEPAYNYFQIPPDFHSVIYRLSDVHFPVINRTCVSVPLPPKFRHRLKTVSGRRRARTKDEDRETSHKNSRRPSNSILGDFPKWVKTSRAFHLDERDDLWRDERWRYGSSRVPGSGSSSRETFETFQSDVENVSEDHPLYWRDLDSLHYTAESGSSSSSEPYGVRSVQRTQWPDEGGSRRGSVAVDRRKSTCLLYLQADHLFYRRLGGEEACIDAMTRHVQRVNSIYRNTELT